MLVKSLGNSHYYVTFIDDFSRKTWLYLLKTKDEVFSKFQEFKAKVGNLTDKKIKTLSLIMEENAPPKRSLLFAKKLGLRGS
jgi:hypothetical protein